MTTNDTIGEERKVDVLAVMDAAAKTCKLYDHMTSANDLPKARSAVAELIKVCRNIQHRVAEEETPSTNDWDCFDNALARIGGTP